MYFLFSVAPYHVSVMGNKSYSQGDQLNLSCISEGGPELNYTWLLSGSLIDNNSNSTLIIDNITTSHGGVYSCNVTNNAGYDSKTVTIYSELNEATYLIPETIVIFGMPDKMSGQIYVSLTLSSHRNF